MLPKLFIRYFILLQFIHVLSHDTEYLQLPYIGYTRVILQCGAIKVYTGCVKELMVFTSTT